MTRLIDADFLKKRIEIVFGQGAFPANQIEELLEVIDDAPTVEERPHGEWIESKERKGHFYCSECVQQDASGKWRELFDYKYNFCPNCGSDNRKRGEQK